MPADTWLEVLEVYCAQCRAPYRRALAAKHCPGLLGDRVDYDGAVSTTA